MFDFIGGGILPSKHMVNMAYDKINQKRNIELINLNDVFKKKVNFPEKQIKSYFENNKGKYKEIYKSVKLIELNPKKLVGSEEFNDTYFKKIDEIDYMLIEGKNLEDIIQNFKYQDAIDFYQKWYQPQLMGFFVIGDIDTNHIIQTIKNNFEPFNNSKELEFPNYKIPDYPDNQFFVYQDDEQESIRFSIFEKMILKRLIVLKTIERQLLAI